MEIQNPHDTFIKELIAEKKYAVELLSASLSEKLSAMLDWTKIRKEPGSFIDEEHRELRSDALFSVSFKDAGELQIYILLEHKSYPYSYIHIQLLEYMCSIYKEQIRQKKEPTLVVPVVFYHGKEKWSYPLSFLDTFKLPADAKEMLKESVLDFSYCIFDLNVRQYEKMNFSSNMQSSLFALHHYWHFRQEEYLREFGSRVGKLIKENPELLEKILAYLMAAAKLELKELYKHIPEKELIQNMGIVELMVEQKKAEAKAEGIEKGKAEEKAEVTKAMLIEGDPTSKIAKVTGLSEAEISKLKSELGRE